MSAAWSPQQRQWLQALGHDVLVMNRSTAAHGPAAAGVSGAPAAVTGAAQTPGAGLLRAVLHAARRRELGDLAAWLPDPATLRGDAAAKRALWPRLRALRRPVTGS